MSFSSANPPLSDPLSLRLFPRFSSFFSFFSLFWFLYFFTSSADLLNLTCLIFKVKLNNALAFFLFFSSFWIFRSFFVDRLFFRAFLFCLFSLGISCLGGDNWISCIGFFVFFIFNYFCYFHLSSQAFFKMDPACFLRLYFWSFVCVGMYATAQVLGSLAGLRLPFAGQTISFLSRGQGFSYEPSYYALYITPYAIFQTTQFLLQSKKERKWRKVLLSNFLLLISTSTGCFFSYVSFVICFVWFRLVGLIQYRSIGLWLLKFWGTFLLLFLGMWIVYPELIAAGFLKFFYTGLKHHSFMERWTMICEYGGGFLENPWIGTGLGGATAYLLGKHQGSVDLLDPEIITGSAPLATNVTMEVLASLGLIGCFAFAYFLYAVYSVFRTSLRIPTLTEAERICLLSFAMSLCVLFFTLQFNGSIMRSYVWIHVGVAVGYARYLQAKYKK